MLFGSEKKSLVLRCASVAAVIVLSASGAVRGALVTIEIAGQVTAVYDDAGVVLEGQINVDDIVAGWYRYDSSTPDGNPSSAVGDYQHGSPPFGVFLYIGGLSFASEQQDVDFLIKMSDDYDLQDSYLLNSNNNLSLPNGARVTAIRWQLEDDTCTALANDALTAAAPVLADWQSGNYLSITCRGGGGVARIEAVIADAYPVPEPASAFIMAFGAAVIGLRRGNVR